MKLSKTEKKILDLAISKGGRYAVEYGYGRGPKGGRIVYGIRDHAAVIKLRDLGKVRITHTDTSMHWSGNGHNTHTSMICFEVLP